MKYDFETVLDRSGCGSLKWQEMRRQNPEVSAGIVPLSVADMEFQNAPEIVRGLKRLLDTAALGYTGPTEDYYDAVIGWMKRRHGYPVEREWIVTTPGVVPALFSLIRAFTDPGDPVLIMPPVYYPFRNAIELSGRAVVENPLFLEDGRYTIDFADLERKASDPRTKLLIFCSPHNPVGRSWSREELQRLMDICLENHVFVISDEIHNDLVMPGNHHTVLATLSGEAALNSVICTAPSKTFNLAGVQVSNIIIPDPERREKMQKVQEKLSNHGLNIFAYEACKTAYNECGDWLEELLAVLDGNRRYLAEFFQENLPEITVSPLEATYLLWADFRALGMDYRELESMMQREAELFLDEGYLFGEQGKGFERWNIACPRKVLEDASCRLLNAVRKRRT